MEAVAKEKRRVEYALVLSFAILAVGMVVGGTFYYQHYKRQFRAGIEQQLSTIAELKVDELVQYRKERLEDGAVFFNNTAFSGLVRRFFEHPEDAEAQQQIQEWIVKCTATDQYDLGCLFDAQGVARMSVPAGRPPISALNSRRVPEVLRSGRVAFQDFNRNEHDQRIYLTLQVPIFDKSDHSQALGVLALRINPETYLYPFINKRWPTPSRTAETLLVRQDGNDALFLNELKFKTNTALNLRISLENTNVVAVKAVLKQEGIVEGVDYRGVPAVAALHAIPDSPWFLVARMDVAEVYAPLRERLRLTILLVSLLLISMGLGIGAIWRHQRVQFYKERYQIAEALRESEERFGRIFEEGPIGIAILDEAFRFIQVNPAFSSMLGYSMDEMRTMAFTDITHPDHVQRDVEQVRRLLRGELSVYSTEKRYIAKSGEELWGLVQVSVVRNAAGAFRYFLAIISDINERKWAEMVQWESEERLRLHTDNSPLAVVEWSADLIITRWTGAAEKMFGWSAEEAIGKPITELPEICEEDLPAVQSVIRQLAGGVSKHVFSSNRNRTRNGQVIHCEWHNSVLHDAGGKTTSVLSQVLDITERKRVEEAIARERQLLRTLIDLLPETFYVKDLDSRFLVVNETLAKQYGKDTPSQLLGLSDADLFPAGLAAEFRAAEMKVFAGEPIINHENSAVFLDGRKHTVLTTKLPFRDNQGRICGLVGIGRDITEIKRAEEALANERALLRTLVDHLPLAVYLKDLAGRKTLANRLEFEYLGATSEAEVLGKTDFDVYLREQAAIYQAFDQEIIRTGQPLINHEASFTKPDGSVINLLASVVPLRDAAGRVTGLVGMNLDITERKRAEEALANERALLRTLVDNLPAAIYLKDLAGRKTLANRLELEYLGATSEAEVLGKTDYDFFPPEQAAAYQANDQEVIRNGQPRINHESSFTKPGGSVIYLSGSVVPLRDAAGRVIGLAGINYDITDRKRIEERLLKVITQTRCILYSGHVTGPEGWRKRALEPVSPFHWDTPVLNEQTAQKIVPLELVAGEPYMQAWERSWNRADAAQMNWNSGNAFLNDLPFYRNEYRCTDKHGVGHWMQEMVTVQKLAENHWQIFSIATDISDLKRIETKLRESQALYHSLVEQMPAGIFRKDAHGRFTFVNSVFCQLKEMKPEQFLGKTIMEVGLPDGELATRSASQHDIIMESGRTIEDDEVYTSMAGETRNYHAVKSPVFDSAGKVVGTQEVLFDITDRKRAEERLLKVVTQTRCILHSGYVTGPKGWRKQALAPVSQFHWNLPMQNEETAQKILPLELAPGEGYMEAWIRSRNPADQAQMNRNSGNAFLNDLPFYRNEFRCTDKHGVVHWMQEFVTVRKLAENRWELFSITTDISDLKKVEAELRRSETELQATLESTADGILAVDNKGKVIKANRRFAELWRIPQSLMDAGDDHALLNFVLEQLSDPDAFLQKEQSLYNTDAVEMDTLAFKDGRIFERYYFPMMMEGAVLGRVWSFRDITERKQAAQRVADALNFNQTMLRASPVGIVVFKAAGPCISANEAIGQIIGGSREEVLKQNFRQLESWKHSGMLAAAEAALAAHTERKLETQIVTTFGRKAWFSGSFVPFQYEGEQHLLLMVSDITERKRQENELREKNSELERFTYTVSHDLKSPLVTVKTFLGYLEQDMARPDRERVKQDLAYVHTATEKMAQLLDELLNLARVGRKKNPAVRVTFRELAQEAVHLVAGRISTGGVKVQVADAVVTLEGDHPRLVEIWQNLVENACKFMGNQPQPQVEIGIEQRGSETVFFVRDNGAGIDPRYQEKVFGLFEKLDPKSEGTGMGLALVKRIVELYDGRIWVESPGLGQGAKFLFTLPAAVIMEPEQSS